MGRVIFKVRKYICGRVEKPLYNYRPRSFIFFENERIGHIDNCDIYFYIRVNHSENKDPNLECINYTPEFYMKAANHHEARQYVIKYAQTIWRTLDIYHPIKNIQPNYGLW